MKEKFKYGDRVTSKVFGYYYGVPGTIIKPAALQHDETTRYIVLLDNCRRLVFRENELQRIPDEQKSQARNEKRTAL